MSKAGSDKGAGLSGYLLPRRICATCGKPTAGRSGGRGSGAGAFHYECRRDAKGNLLVREEAA